MFNLNRKGLFPIFILLVLMSYSGSCQEDDQFRKVKFGITIVPSYFPEPDITTEIGNIPFNPGSSFNLGYGINLSYDLNKYWTLNGGLIFGGYPMAEKLSLNASDYPDCLEFNIDESGNELPIRVDNWDLFLSAERHFFPNKKYNFSLVAGIALKTVPHGQYSSEITYVNTFKEVQQVLLVEVRSNPEENTLWGGMIGIGHYFNLVRNRDLRLNLLYNVASSNVAEGYYEILYDTECYTAGKYEITGQYLSLNLTYIFARPHKEKRIKNNDNQQ